MIRRKKSVNYKKLLFRFIGRRPFVSFFIFIVPFGLFIFFLLGLICSSFHKEITCKMKSFIHSKKPSSEKIKKMPSEFQLFFDEIEVLNHKLQDKITECPDGKK